MDIVWTMIMVTQFMGCQNSKPNDTFPGVVCVSCQINKITSSNAIQNFKEPKMLNQKHSLSAQRFKDFKPYGLIWIFENFSRLNLHIPHLYLVCVFVCVGYRNPAGDDKFLFYPIHSSYANSTLFA